MTAYADINKFEAEQRGEFGIGSQRSSARPTSRRLCMSTKTSGADLSDTSMDCMSLHCGDLGGAIIGGADFSDAIIDLPQKQALCKYSNGTNTVTGVSTRKSLGCGNSRRNAYGSPSSPLLSAPPPKLLDRDGFCDEATGM